MPQSPCPRHASTPRLATTLLAAALLTVPALAQVDTGDADFTRFVALGDSLSAAFASGSLVITHQDNSIPLLIARQAGVGEIEQPLVSEPGLPPELTLVSLSPLTIAPKASQPGAPLNLGLPRPYDNLSIPGADACELLQRTSDAGGMFDLVLRRLGFTAVEQALALSPTFVYLWAGSNDVLGAAVSGRVIDGVTLTQAAPFEACLRTMVGALAAGGAGGVLGNIADVPAIPFVTTIPPVVVNPATGQPVLINGQPVFLIGPAGPLTPADFVLLPASALLAQGIGIPMALGGTGQPLPDAAVLDASEVSAIRARTAELNAIIAAVAGDIGWALADIEAFFEDVKDDGYRVGGVDFTTDFLVGGVFSFDGVHPTDLGYAVAANVFLAAINEHYDARIPPVDLSPFFFGTGIGAGAVSREQAAAALFTPRAERHLRRTLGIPSDRQLDRIAGSIGGGGGGDGAERPDGLPDPGRAEDDAAASPLQRPIREQ
ncbi:MAG TPA: SGNH/GDSL hydrolase family protein [Thermoanaerobaculia bacterium]|nr:SGNH/GDSL hydrolase family protein [Thermoanaerobaculia bacterium]